MNNKKKLPVFVSELRLMEFRRVANYFAKEFTELIFPVMLKYGILDEPHIKKYLQSETMEDIYRDALKENPGTIKEMEKLSVFCDVDVWANIRSINSPVKNPSDEGFVFAPMPRSDYNYRQSIIKAMSVKDGKIFVDDKILEEECIVKPTDKQQELFEMVVNFCEALKEKNFHRKLVNTLFVNTPGGIKPNVNGIVNHSIWLSVKK